MEQMTPEQEEAVEDVLATVRARIPTLRAGDPWRSYFVRLSLELQGRGLDEPGPAGLRLVPPPDDQ